MASGKPKADKAVLAEFFTLFQGLRSPNVLTRVYMWVDVVEDVFLVRTDFFSGDSRDPNTLSGPDHAALGERLGGRVLLDGEISGGFQSFLVNSRLLRIVGGVPFGRYFVPSRVYWWMIHTKRYDPHNSHLSILYRTGLLGFLCYLTIVLGGFVRGLSRVLRTKDSEERLYLLAVLGAFLFHFVHSTTDVTLESAYKGVLFWVLLGLLEVIPRVFAVDKKGLVA